MNYAFMSFSCPRLTLAEMIDTARQVGYGGIEPRAGAGHAHGVELDAGSEERRQMRSTAAAQGIDLCCLAAGCRYADPNTVASEVEATHSYIDLAADVGAPRLRVFGGRIPEGIVRAEALDCVAEALTAVADHAAERDVVVCLETHDDWCDPAHIAEIMQRVNHPNIAVNWDVLHPVHTAGYTLSDAYTMLRAWIRHVHIHDATWTSGQIEYVAIGAGAIDHREVVRLLSSDDYAGYLSGEWINWEAHSVHLPRELTTLRAYEARHP